MNLTTQYFINEDYMAFQPVEAPEELSIMVPQMGNPNQFNRSMTLDGKVHAIAGIQERWPQVGDAWVWFDDEVLEHHRWSFARIVKYDLLPIANAHFKRITAPVDVGNEKAIRFIEWLGFEREFDVPLRQFGLYGKGDYWQYVRLN